MNNRDEWNEWDEANKFEMPTGQFTFEYHVTDFDKVDKGNGDIIKACIESLESEDIFDDYDDMSMKIEYISDFEKIIVKIFVFDLLR